MVDMASTAMEWIDELTHDPGVTYPERIHAGEYVFDSLVEKEVDLGTDSPVKDSLDGYLEYDGIKIFKDEDLRDNRIQRMLLIGRRWHPTDRDLLHEYKAETMPVWGSW
jgi:hypothetical protein